MTTHRVYKCNLCGDEIKPSPHASKEGFGVHFTAAGASVFKRTFETEHHICHRCAQSVHDELRKRVPAPAISAGDAVFAFAAAQPPADGALNTIAAMFSSAEEIEGPDGLAVMVDMSVWNEALEAFEEIIGDSKND